MDSTKKYPFKFLDAYSKKDKEFFFGREEEIETLYGMILQTNILLVYGASGTGKTSIIQCGLANKFQTYDWLALNIRRGIDINHSLQVALREAAGISDKENPYDSNPLLDDLFRPLTPPDTKPETELAKNFKNVYLKYFRPIYLIFDQMEELFILGNDEEQKQFIQSVKEILLLPQPIKIIFSIREEYLGCLYEFEKSIPQLLRKKLRVEAMNLQKIKQIIAGVAANENSLVSIKKDEVEIFAQDLFEKIKGEDKAIGIQLPYLQVYLDKIYLTKTSDEERKTEAVFQKEDIQKVGEIGDVLRDFLEERVQKIASNLNPEYPYLKTESLWEVLSLFVTLEGTKEPLDKNHIFKRLPQVEPHLIERLITAFLNNRILNYSEKDGLYEIAHDSLALQIAGKRTDEEIALLEIRRLIKSQSALKEDTLELFSEKQLNFIEPYLGQIPLSDSENNLIRKSHERVLWQKKKKKRNLIAAFSLVVLVLLFTSGLAVWALQNKKQSEKALLQFLSEKSAKDLLEFTNLEKRANTIIEINGCPEEIIEQMAEIAKDHEDSLVMNEKINSFIVACQ